MCFCVCVCRALCACTACHREMHTNSTPAPPFKLLSSLLVLQVPSRPPSHLQTLLTYSMRCLSACPRRQQRMFVQDYYQFSIHVRSFRLLQLNSGQMQTSQLIFPFQFYPLASFLSNLGASFSALTLTKDWRVRGICLWGRARLHFLSLSLRWGGRGVW